MALTKVSRGLLSTGIVDNSNATAITIDSSENVGIGVVPEAWSASWTALDLGSKGSLSNSGNFVSVGNNAYNNGAWRYKDTQFASDYYQENGTHTFRVAPSGTADAAISWTTAMIVDNSGNVGIGVSPSAKLSLPAQASGDSGVARFAIESAVDSNDFTIAQYEDGTGTYTQLGQNISLNSGGNVVVLDSAHRTAGITFDGRGNGSLMFQTGAANANEERMRITSSGNVGIGNSSPSALSWPNGSSGGLFLQAGALLSAYNAGTVLSQNWYYNGGEKYIANGSASRYSQNGAEHVWSSAGNNTSGAGAGLSWQERMRIDSSGNLLVGKTSTSLTTAGVRLAPNGGSEFVSQGNNNTALNIGSTDDSYISLVGFFTSGGTQCGYILGDGSSVSLVSLSDYRLKEDWQPIVNATQTLMQLNPYNFAWKADGSRTDGFLAHELQEVVPTAAHGVKDELDSDGNPKYQGIDQSKLVPLLVATIQELEARLTALENN